jgi:hypothetical protein
MDIALIFKRTRFDLWVFKKKQNTKSEGSSLFLHASYEWLVLAFETTGSVSMIIYAGTSTGKIEKS